ncbi:hypothetical protein [Sorangium sp. So ce1182]|uniref:hypothetical protein n=1 Tax=Sorangium sp. So ce1182 TaxID=3133334 RepID=UPI003F5EE94C
MFSASLTTAIFHTIFRSGPELPDQFERNEKLPRILQRLINQRRSELSTYTVPTIVRTLRPLSQLQKLAPFRTIDSPSGTFLWGRLSIVRLIDYMVDGAGVPPEDEYFDLGTPFERAGGDDPFVTCSSLLTKSAWAHAPKAIAAVIDCGDDNAGGTPETFGGCLTHLVTQDIVMSLHAERVTATLIDELNNLGALSDVHVVCALVRPPKSVFGLDVLKQDNCVELIDAISETTQYISNISCDAVVSISMGTHVGPHNGSSPLEQIAASAVMPSSRRYVVAAAGNDGERGVHATMHLPDNTPDVLRLQIGPTGTTELLVEFWWEDDGTNDVSIEVDVRDAADNEAFTKPLTISSATSLTPFSAGNATYKQHSLIGAISTGSMRCISYGLSALQDPGDLSNCDIRFIVTAARGNVVIHAWLIASADRKTTFVQSDLHGTVTAPSTADDVVGVSGVDALKRPWSQSSRGHSFVPLHRRCWLCGAFESPKIAHLARFGSGHSSNSWGTSFAAPRVSARILSALVDPAKRHRCSSVSSTLEELLGAPLGTWNPRVGYGSL